MLCRTPGLCSQKCIYYLSHWVFIAYGLFFLAFVYDWSVLSHRRLELHSANDVNDEFSVQISSNSASTASEKRCIGIINGTYSLVEDDRVYFKFIGGAGSDSKIPCLIEGSTLLDDVLLTSQPPSANHRRCSCRKRWSGPACSIPVIVRKSDYSDDYPLSVRENPRRIINAFPFNGEFDLLDIRLSEIGDLVDVFLVLESNYTSHGDPKRLELRERLAARQSILSRDCKIVHVLLDNFPANKASLSDAGDDGGRAVEHLLRNHLSDFGLRQRLTGTRNDDIFLLTDADEIPAREAVLFLKLHDGYPEPVGLHLQASIFGFFWRASSETHVYSAVTVGTLATIFNYRSMSYRDVRTPLVLPPDPASFLSRLHTGTADISPWSFGDIFLPAGWHCSWCSNPDGIIRKLRDAVRGDYPRWGDYPHKQNVTYIRELIRHGVWFDNKRQFLPADVRKSHYAPPSLMHATARPTAGGQVSTRPGQFDYILYNPYLEVNRPKSTVFQV